MYMGIKIIHHKETLLTNQVPIWTSQVLKTAQFNQLLTWILSRESPSSNIVCSRENVFTWILQGCQISAPRSFFWWLRGSNFRPLEDSGKTYPDFPIFQWGPTNLLLAGYPLLANCKNNGMSSNWIMQTIRSVGGGCKNPANKNLLENNLTKRYILRSSLTTLLVFFVAGDFCCHRTTWEIFIPCNHMTSWPPIPKRRSLRIMGSQTGGLEIPEPCKKQSQIPLFWRGPADS